MHRGMITALTYESNSSLKTWISSFDSVLAWRRELAGSIYPSFLLGFVDPPWLLCVCIILLAVCAERVGDCDERWSECDEMSETQLLLD